jgi:hypothetical protein
MRDNKTIGPAASMAPAPERFSYTVWQKHA